MGAGLHHAAAAAGAAAMGAGLHDAAAGAAAMGAGLHHAAAGAAAMGAGLHHAAAAGAALHHAAPHQAALHHAALHHAALHQAGLHRAMAAAAALVAAAFALSTLERWRARRRRHELAWTVALAMFALAAAALGVGVGVGWSEPAFRLFYFFGAIANVPFLALGTIYLLAGPRRGDRWAAGIALAVAFAGGVIAVAPLRHAIPADALVPQGSDVFGPLPRILAVVASAGGAMVVFGGAAWSALRFRRGRMVGANVLIAGGTAILSASGVLNSVADEMTGFAITLVVGISVLFAGFLVASTSPSPRPRPDLPRPSGAGGAAASRPPRGAARPRS
jgi:hypothetical protein